MKEYVCAVQNPITIPDHSEPEPDFALINRITYSRRKGQPLPEDVALLIEVSDATLAFDRKEKHSLYAAADIQEYWIINLQEDRIEVYTKPDPRSAVYRTVNMYDRGGAF